MVGLSECQKFWVQRLLLREARLLAQVQMKMRGTGLDHEQAVSSTMGAGAATAGEGTIVAAGANAVAGNSVGADDSEEESSQEWKRLNNLLMQLRKVCNHPYCMPSGRPAGATGEDLVEASGKLMLLDRLLHKLKAGGHRAVLFSQFTSVLNILEDYLALRNFRWVGRSRCVLLLP